LNDEEATFNDIYEETPVSQTRWDPYPFENLAKISSPVREIPYNFSLTEFFYLETIFGFFYLGTIFGFFYIGTIFIPTVGRSFTGVVRHVRCMK